MTIERIKNLRRICAENYQLLDNKDLFSVVLKDRDVDGGINFEEEINYYTVGNDCWCCRFVIEKTVQPAFGPTITTERNEANHTITDEELLAILQDDPTALKAFEAYEYAIVNRFCGNM